MFKRYHLYKVDSDKYTYNTPTYHYHKQDNGKFYLKVHTNRGIIKVGELDNIPFNCSIPSTPPSTFHHIIKEDTVEEKMAKYLKSIEFNNVDINNAIKILRG